MLLFLQAAPLLLLLALLLSGRAGPVAAVCAALLAAMPAALVSLPAGVDGAAFLGAEALRAVFLAAQPIGVVVGGLLFHAAVTRDGTAAAARPEPRRIFVATLLMGAFMESVTGFAVGAVFALAALRGMGIGGAPAGALALLSLCLVPWGGLGPGTSLGAALIGLPAQEVARVASVPNAAWLMVLVPVLWRLCAAAGIAVPARERAAQLAIMGVAAALLVAGHAVLPFEVLGILATGLPLLYALWRLDPPGDAIAWRRALRVLAPYVLLTAGLLAARAVPDPPALRPWMDLPAFPVTHVAVVLWIVASALLLATADPRRRAGGALRRAGRPALVLLLYVLLARVLAGSGATAALAQAAADALGPLAPYAVPPLGLLSGVVTGSNVGSNAALMPVQYRLGLAAGLPPLLAPGVHNFAGAAGAGMSFAVAALVCGLLADGTRPAQLWRLLLPSLLAVVAIGWITMALMA
ncbi:MAG TPA: L-lactate permease [Acetobacteraceae bacterium]|nr:L-lactate permease [Acetobacteraceae bacterium]